MGNAVLFLNTFLSYVLVLVIIAVLAAAAIMIGIKLRKNKDLKTQMLNEATAADATAEADK